ncbi:hypothetical protein ABI_13500 [Asticcacaulis biprosthecium C19]|uniref:Uncharacterized protein n=2 Tax=Asticcacaulis biprosthecium TaxID=76891 RepID=F4QI45_9CAUL|nr:hypothetical protein ABI_13500 [Asticcacaulis biprosthecium C19]
MADAEIDLEPEAQSDAQHELSDTTYVGQVGTNWCTYDCSGHEAGFAYAIENELTDTADCYENDDSFLEGCEAYVDALETLTAEKLKQKIQQAADAAEAEIRAES